jgi:hypothetical protein
MEENMKTMISYTVASLLILTFSIVFAQEPKEQKSSEKESMKMCLCPMHKMMMKNMMKMEVTATQDGGIVVLMGDKMVKYDKNLNQVKEVVVRIDMEHVKAMMHEQMKDCPMRQKMMEGVGTMKHGECMRKKMMKEEASE